jgi:chromosome segregation ATPase
MSQTKSIKIRLSPIVERMKNSLDKIQALEVTLEESKPEEEKEQASIRSRHPKDDEVQVHCKSRELLTRSMEMLQRKLGRLSQMEIDCDVAEDRREELQHHFLQASTNTPSRELAATRQRNLQLESQVSQLEEVVHQLGRKCTKVDHLQQVVDSLSEQLQKLESEEELYESTAERSNDLECQVKQLTVMCDDLLQTLVVREVQNEVLVRQLRHEQPEAFDGGNKLDTKASPDTSFSSTAQESDDSSSFDCGDEQNSIGEIHPAHSASSEEGETKSPKRFSRLQNLASAVLKGSATTNDSNNASSPTSESVKGMSIVVEENTLESSFATEQLKAVRAENTLLIQEQQDMESKCVTLGTENTWQSTRIAHLEQQLQATEQRLSISSSPATTMASPRQETKGSFFRKLLNSPSVDGSRQRGSVHGPSKAELVSQGLGVVESQGLVSEPNNRVPPLVEPSLPEVAGTEAPSVATKDENTDNAPSPPGL